MLKRIFAKKANVLNLKFEAEQGDKDAQYLLGKAYEFGENGYIRNLTLAYRWYLKSATQGHLEAESRLSLLKTIIRGNDQVEAKEEKTCL